MSLDRSTQKFISVLLFVLLIPGLFAGQTAEVDSLQQVLRSTAEGETVDILNQLSEIHAGTDWEKSQRYANLALDLATSLDDKNGLAVANANLAVYYNQIENYRLALDHATLALIQFEQLSYSIHIGRTLRIIGTTYSLLNQSDQSLDYFLRALMIFEDIENDEEVAVTLIVIGDVYSQWGQSEKALHFLERALSIYQNLGDFEGVLISQNRYAQALMRLRRFDEAKYHLEQALLIADQHADLELHAKIYTSLGELYYQQLQLNTAQKYFLNALDLKMKNGSPGEVAVALSDVGRIYQETGDTQRALSYFQQGQELAEQSGETIISAEIYLQIGELYMKDANQAKTIQAMLAGLNIAQKVKDLATIERANDLLTSAYSQFGRPDKALTYQRALQLTRDELNRQRGNQRVAELEVRYELDKRDRELIELKGVALVKEVEYNKQFVTMWIILAFSIFIMLLVVAFVFYRSRLIRRAEREKMDSALRLKADFTAMLVHDLRSPLTSIFGFAELLKMSEKPFERIREIATTIRESSQKMLQLVNEMLDLSKFEAGKMVLNKTDSALKPIVTAAMQMLDPVASQQETTLTLDADDGLPVCNCDIRKVEQVITNFIGNAIEHTPVGSKVDIHLQERQIEGESFLYFSVSDDGPGVPLDQQHKIFDKYAQLDSPKSAKGKGTGLGLAVSQMIIEQHGGDVGYRDRIPSGGVFYFYIPCQSATPSPQSPSDDIQART